MILICPMLISALTGYFIVVPLLLSNNEPLFESIVLKICLAIGTGYGVTSCIYFLWLVFYGKSGYGFMIIEVILLIVLFFFNRYLKKRRGLPLNAGNQRTILTGKPASKLLLLILSCVMVSSLISFVKMTAVLRHGGWDAWQTWNLLARFLYRGGENWSTAFNNLPAFHHPDYPLLIPASVARLWQYGGAETQIAPIWLGGLFTFAAAGLLFSAVSLLKGRNAGYLAAIILLGSANYLVLGSYQYADIPVGFYFLATLVLLLLQDLSPGNYMLSGLAGMMAAFASWTKNEGALFFLVIICAYLLLLLFMHNKKDLLRRVTAFVVGALPVLSVLLYFKTGYAPPSDLLLDNELQQIFLRLSDPSRYMEIAKALVKTIIDTNPLLILIIIYPLYTGIDKDGINKPGTVIVLTTLLLMCIGYCIIYLITPYDIQWHLESSLSRILMQLWPCIVLAAVTIARTSDVTLFRKQHKL
jgi:hypothetical protein